LIFWLDFRIYRPCCPIGEFVRTLTYTVKTRLWCFCYRFCLDRNKLSVFNAPTS
jgi:hypothetical protein